MSDLSDANNFTLHQELGRGGTATVYLADDHGAQRSVAFKAVSYTHLTLPTIYSV